MKIGTIYGIKIYLNLFFLALLGLFFVAGILAKGLIAFGIVLIHEFAHAFAARRLAVPVADVELLPFGGVTRMGGDMAVQPKKEIIIAAAGPLSNVIMFLLGIAFKNYGFWDEQLGSFFLQSNLVIAGFNVLPALPLDGGRVYRAILAGRIGLKKATYQAASLGQSWAVIIILVGAGGLALGWAGLDIMITGMFLLYAATRERTAAPYLFMRHMMQKREELRNVGVMPALILVAGENSSLGEVVRNFMPEKFHLVAVFSEGMEYKGIISEDKLVEGLFKYGLDCQIGILID